MLLAGLLAFLFLLALATFAIMAAFPTPKAAFALALAHLVTIVATILVRFAIVGIDYNDQVIRRGR